MLIDRSTLQAPGLGRDTLTEKTVQQLLGWLKDGTATRNPVLAKLVTSFIGLMAKAGKLSEATVDDLAAFKQHELSSHHELYRVVRAGDAQKASRTTVAHIEASQAVIVRGFERLSVQPSERVSTAGVGK
jgi:hypothetical protein